MMAEEFTFRWHFPRGSLSKKMSGLELATFVMRHMPFIVPLLAEMPTIQRAFQSLFLRIATMEPSVLDEVHDWFKPIIRDEEDDIILMRPVLSEEERKLAELEADRAKAGIWDTEETRAKHNDHLAKLDCPVGI
jgi:hypothetical protein